MIGTVFQHYRIEAKLGESELGVAYRAVDTRLDQTVVLQVLGAAAPRNLQTGFAKDADILSQLRHPGIVSVYDIETADASGQPVVYIAMEPVAGKALGKIIRNRGLLRSKALHYAVQIADALAAAHAAGIVHGGLKPSNIIVTDLDEIKVSDFGLAKLIEPDQPDVHAATESVHLPAVANFSGEHTAYLSPEQAEGHPADERSDIFAFGAILYEMMQGRRAFRGNSTLSMIAAVIHEDPAPMDDADGRIPRELEHIVKRCLRKSPQQRWQRMTDVKLALEDLLAEFDSAEVARSVRARRGLSLYAGAALVLIALAAGAYFGSAALKQPRPAFQRLTYRRGNIAEARFAPDGTVLLSAQWGAEPTRIFSLRPGRNEYRPIDLPEARILSISSLGEVAILLGSSARGTPGTLARVPLSGGAPREILTNVNDADWSPDGANLAVSRTVGGRNQIEYPIGRVLEESGGRPPLSLHVSPRGDSLAFFEYDNAIGEFAVTLLNLHGKKRVLSRGWRVEGGLAWSPKGDEIWYCGARTDAESTLRAVTLDGRERVLAPVPAAVALQDVGRSGQVLATVEDSRLGILGLALGSKQERDLSWFDGSWVYDLSANGKQILFAELSYGNPRNPAIYIRNTDGSPAVRLGDCNRPTLSPDGKLVACIVSDGPRTILSLLPTGPGEARSGRAPRMRYERVEWFPDGQRILFTGNEENRPPRTFVQDLNGGKPVPLTPEGTTASRVSPDEKYATVVANGQLSLFPIGGGRTKVIANLEPGQSVIRWSGDGRSLFLRKSEGPASLRIDRLNVMTGRQELWKEITTPDAVGVQLHELVMTPDGNSYAYSFQRDISTLYLVEGLR
jgi:eukaryotic-like serine/threonine-protein kinase